MSEFDEAVAHLDELKEQCTEACADEAVHAPHRAELEAAYAKVASLSPAVAAPTGPPNHAVTE